MCAIWGINDLNKLWILKVVWCWHKDRNIDQWNKIESLEINSHTYGNLMDTLSLTKEARIYNGEKTISFTSDAWKTVQPLVKEWNKHFLTPYTKINSKWIKDIRVRPEKNRDYKTLRGQYRQNTFWHKSQQDPLWCTSKSNRNKNKNRQMGPN